jgi:hypothetical protein
MRSRLTHILMAMTLGIAALAQPSQSPVFPTVSFYTLAKSRVTLPADLHSDRTLLVLYFRLRQQPEVDAWNATIDHWRATNPALGTYTCMVSPRVNVVSRWWQNASLRSALPDSKRWSTMLPLYVDKPEFLKRLSINSEQQVVLLVTDRQGHVVARADGPPTAQTRLAIQNTLPEAGVAPGIKSQP